MAAGPGHRSPYQRGHRLLGECRLPASWTTYRRCSVSSSTFVRHGSLGSCGSGQSAGGFWDCGGERFFFHRNVGLGQSGPRRPPLRGAAPPPTRVTCGKHVPRPLVVGRLRGVTVIVSYLTNPMPESELNGLVYGVTAIPHEAEVPFYHPAAFWAVVVAGLFAVFNIWCGDPLG